jgi:hypothetical protein
MVRALKQLVVFLDGASARHQAFTPPIKRTYIHVPSVILTRDRAAEDCKSLTKRINLYVVFKYNLQNQVGPSVETPQLRAKYTIQFPGKSTFLKTPLSFMWYIGEASSELFNWILWSKVNIISAWFFINSFNSSHRTTHGRAFGNH